MTTKTFTPIDTAWKPTLAGSDDENIEPKPSKRYKLHAMRNESKNGTAKKMVVGTVITPKTRKQANQASPSGLSSGPHGANAAGAAMVVQLKSTVRMNRTAKNVKKMKSNQRKKSTPSIAMYKQPPKIILDPSFVEEYLAKKENKVDSVRKEPMIVSVAPNRDDDVNDDSVVFVKEQPATRADLKIVRLRKKIAALKKEKRVLQSQIQPKVTIALDDDDDNDGYDADNDETMESASSSHQNTSQLNLELDESWVQKQIKDICTDGTLGQVFKEMGTYL